MSPPLWLVTRADLSPAQQAVQSAHAAARFALDHREAALAWRAGGEALSLLTVRDHACLVDLEGHAAHEGAVVAPFHEEDLGGALTAVALGPGPIARRLTARLPLTLAAFGGPEPEATRAAWRESIRARLASFRCSLCRRWLTPPEDRPPTHTAEGRMCDCPRTAHASMVPDVDAEDITWLLEEVDRLRTELAARPSHPTR